MTILKQEKRLILRKINEFRWTHQRIEVGGQPLSQYQETGIYRELQLRSAPQKQQPLEL